MSDLRIQAAQTAERNYFKEREEARRVASMLAYGHTVIRAPMYRARAPTTTSGRGG